MSTWSELPGDLLGLIADKLICITDYVRYGAVCVSWRSAFTEYQRRRHLPLLMIPTKDNKQTTRSFYCLIERRVLDFQVPVPHDKFCCGSHQGWLVTVDENIVVHLLNPFSTINNEIHFPPLTAFSKLHEDDPIDRAEDLRRAVLSGNPTSNPNCVVIIIYGGFGRLAFSHPGDKAWTSFDLEWQCFEDMIYYKGQVYAVDHLGRVVVFDISSLYPKMTKIIRPPRIENTSTKRYIVESLGELLQIKRVVRRSYEDDTESSDESDVESDGEDMESDIGDDMSWSTVGFRVFKLDPIGPKWIKVKSLLDRVIFLGNNTSMSLSALDFPGCKPNCIYFTNDYIDGYTKVNGWHHDMGVFNLIDGSIKPHYPIPSEISMPLSIWVEPMLLSRG